MVRNDDRGTWHVHLHVICQARYIPHQDYTRRKGSRVIERAGLSRTWLSVTGDSDVVWLRAITDRGAAAAEVAKYVTKPLSPSLFHDNEALDEFVIALKSRRLCLTFGTWFKIRLTERSPDWDPADWVPVCNLDDLIKRAAGGEVHCQLLIEKFRLVLPCQKRPPPSLPAPLLFGAGPLAPSAPPHSTLTASNS